MTDITLADLDRLQTNLHTFIDARFEQHEEVERLMLDPVVEKVKNHEQILHGISGRGGVIKDINLVQWVAHAGLVAGVGKWIQGFFH